MSESKNKNTMEKNNKIHISKIQVFSSSQDGYINVRDVLCW